ncbi:hypothetical protein [Saccharopolyspora flava]|uniref:Uncharacterized protein n=1 Tax=Saccharopolyspora flava TaxID=95161 RepID=A0A1I6SMJ5_9PSEU|nr:hypothetical protein [Saccharopolyspora flava]SFS78161.1 hypothetical protein SAMN05660874_03233 [Saccharopolyspora flava]
MSARAEAAGPQAPEVAAALADRAEIAEFIEGVADQRSLLALAGTVDALLASPQVVREHGTRLHDVLLRDLDSVRLRSPLIAAARLAGAVRLAIADVVPPFAVLGALTGFPAEAPEEFTEALPRLIGAAMDRWAGEPAITAPLRAALERLRHDEAASVDAAFELACDQLRAALAASEVPDVLAALTEARARFATVDAAEQARHDARAHAAACDAVLAFAAGDRSRLAEAAEELAAALDQRAAWLRGTHRSPWLRPRHAADGAWRRLVLLLRNAADRLAETVCMDVWEALGAVLEAYAQVRALQPLPGARAEGLAVVVEPAIENAVLRDRSRLAALRRAVAEVSAAEDPPLPPAAARLLLERVEAAGTDGPEPTREPGTAAVSRAHRVAPALVRVLGERDAAGLTEALTDDDLRLLEGVVHSGELARSRTAHPVLDPLLERLLGQLAAAPEFTGRVRATFGLLLEQTLRFLLSRADLGTATWGLGEDYRRELRDGEPRPRESALQRDYHQWLATGQLGGLVAVESGDVARGRADVTTSFGALRYVTEVKRELRDASRERVEAAHLAQAAEYAGANAAFGQLLVLDLTPHPRGTPRVDERVWLARHGGRCVVVGVVTGNRPAPHRL